MSVYSRLGLDDDVIIPEGTLSTEMIKFQPNDGFVSAATSLFEKIIMIVKDRNLSGAKLYKHKDMKILLSRLDSLIYDRFGIRTKQIYGEHLAAVMTVAPNNFSIVSKIDSFFPKIKEAAKVVKKPVKDVKDINNFNNDIDSIVVKYYESIKALDKKLYEDGVYVDLEKARIDNLPKEYVAFMMSDLGKAVNTFNLAADELCGIFLHEIGHAFTHIEYSIYSVRTTSAIMDTIKENIEIKNKTYVETLRIVYENILDGKDKNFPKGEVAATIKIMDKYMRETASLTKNVRVSTNSEQLADAFGARFGMGEQLVSALTKIRSVVDDNLNELVLMPIIIENAFWLVIFMITSGSLISALGMLGIGIVITLVFYLIIVIVDSLITKGKTKEIRTYEDSKRRYKEIRNEMVKQLRSRLPKDMVAPILESISRVDAYISMTVEDEKELNILDKIIRTMSFDAKEHIEVSEVDELIEDLMSNDLYIASNRIKLMKGK